MMNHPSSEIDIISEFHRRHNGGIVPYYTGREDRNRWAASYLQEFAGSKILNLGGGGKRHLQMHLGNEFSVHEIDVTGDCDTVLDLDQVEKLPFEDGQFDTACAFEVLEHLEQFHLVLEEMYRVTKSSLFVSLPNAAVHFLLILRNQKNLDQSVAGGVYSKFYGLPTERPEDRHRWWMCFEDIVRYFVWFEEQKSCSIEFYIPAPDPTVSRRIMRKLMGDRMFLNLYATNVWMRIDKGPK